MYEVSRLLVVTSSISRLYIIIQTLIVSNVGISGCPFVFHGPEIIVL